MEKYKTFKDFYPYYLSEHSNKYTKLMHFMVTYKTVKRILKSSWLGHFFIEKNKPATFKYPFYSFIGDHKMYLEILQGKHKIF